MDLNISSPCTTGKQKVDCVIVALTEQQWFNVADGLLPWENSGIVAQVAEGEFSAKSGQFVVLHTGKDAARLLLVGLGPDAKLDGQQYRAAAAVAVHQLRERKLASWAFDLSLVEPKDMCLVADWLLDGALLEVYRFERYKSASANEVDNNKQIVCGFSEISAPLMVEIQQCVARRHIISEGVWLARNLVNEPGNVKTPAYLGQTAWQLAQEYGFNCTLLGPAELKRLGFGAMLAVAQGSDCEPRLIAVEYSGAPKGKAPFALVGKGVTFDSGGISLKPGEGMDQMKMDMAGGAAVLATIATIARLHLPINVIGVIPAVENMPSGGATRPGDIVTSLSGQTIEILNTDAEGRLILADALTWVQGKNPRVIIDLATLTGACILALGHHASAVLGNDESVVEELLHAGTMVGERLWQLPLFVEYTEQLKSSVADMKNIGGRPAGTITAAAFLQKFIVECPWAHVDIAGTAWEEKGRPGQPVGATGFGVRLLVEYLQCQR
jgi:leucyl aminopeptidase